jgi:RimJ/RimL family protein N-acetyltransferase
MKCERKPRRPASIKLRPITLLDAPLLYRWRCLDEETRNNSLTKHTFTGESHMGWLCEQLAKQCPMYIGTHLHLTVGAVYFISDKVSMIIAPEHRGRGYGTGLLRAALMLIDRPCVADILDHNAASHHVFQKCGFAAIETVPGSTRYQWHP